MIYGIGVDIAEVSRFRQAHARFGDRFCQKILTPEELQNFPAARDAGRYLAMRFAAKEATSKALGTGFKRGIAPRQIGVKHAPSGKPSLTVAGTAATLFERERISGAHVSLSDDGGFAIAYVVLESDFQAPMG